MDINRLNQGELNYELTIRGLQTGKVDDMRANLRLALKAEKGGEVIVVHPYPFTIEKDIEVLTEKVSEIETLLQTFSGERGTTEFKKIMTKIQWSLSRLRRCSPVSEDNKKTVARLRGELILALGRLQMKADGEEEESDSSDLEVDLSATFIGRSSSKISLYNWDIKFSGDSGQTLNSFLDRVLERPEAQGIAKQQLFKAALDLFDGKALIWYRANKSKFHSWLDMVRELKKEFLPRDYDERLMGEIKKRMQGKEETMGMYVAIMSNMFSRLSIPMTDAQKLAVLKRNINPFYQTQIGLTEVDAIDDLVELGRRLETFFQKK